MSDLQKLCRILAVAVLATCPTMVKASDLSSPADVEDRMAADWTLSVDPMYGWLPGLSGNMRFRGGPGVKIDVTALDLLENLDALIDAIDGIYMGSGELRNSQYGLQWDLFFLNLGGSSDFGAKIGGAIDVGFSVTLATLAGNYRIYDTPTTTLDLIAGIRYTDVDLDVGIAIGPLSGTVSGGDSWVDPIVGIRGKHNIDSNWYIKGQALYGGFGVASDSLYDVAGFVGYEWQSGTELYAGWRVADTNYENGPFKWDIKMSGPMMGLTLKF